MRALQRVLAVSCLPRPVATLLRCTWLYLYTMALSTTVVASLFTIVDDAMVQDAVETQRNYRNVLLYGLFIIVYMTLLYYQYSAHAVGPVVASLQNFIRPGVYATFLPSTLTQFVKKAVSSSMLFINDHRNAHAVSVTLVHGSADRVLRLSLSSGCQRRWQHASHLRQQSSRARLHQQRASQAGMGGPCVRRWCVQPAIRVCSLGALWLQVRSCPRAATVTLSAWIGIHIGW